MNNFKKNSIKGQSLFEVVLALFVITMIIVGVVVVSTNSISNSLFSRNKTLAARYAQEGIEWLRLEKERDFSALATVADTATYCLDNLNFNNIGACNGSEFIGDTEFAREVNFTKLSENSKVLIEATVITYWTDSKGYHESRSSTVFTDIRQR